MPDAKTSFEKDIPARIANDPDKAKNVGAIFLFKITGDDGGTWTVNLKDELGVVEGDAGNSMCTIETSSENWVQISDNPAVAMQLYFSGELKVAGDAMLATKLQEILS
ncbi:MAG: SCP2 sterol-binding domain-containing protein [Sandaracinus sp.]|nr:SCP2 sterol-binding domain-containing protein [Sandaracinus sp.]MCB9619422.1 SCP2 sterol-binding domain-containing protein [Sandaracinus sp.]MCB9621872.1 SCP2 sterol-binding domain-containing protein [Sandaracinus sp.]MCB9635942.1 SCP2 sterol-binding domain-containing protein [Sandaracinus sp.]